MIQPQLSIWRARHGVQGAGHACIVWVREEQISSGQGSALDGYLQLSSLFLGPRRSTWPTRRPYWFGRYVSK